MTTETNPDYITKSKSDDWGMQFVGFLLFFIGARRAFMEDFYTTYRLPFMAKAHICYPTTQKDVPPWVLEHEKHHVEQFKPWYGPLLVIGAQVLPLPVLFSGRWFVERYAYLDDIKHKRRTVDQAVEVLWSGYGFAWPKSWMKSWFTKKLEQTQ